METKVKTGAEVKGTNALADKKAPQFVAGNPVNADRGNLKRTKSQKSKLLMNNNQIREVENESGKTEEVIQI